MADFVNPFPGLVPARKMSREELVRALRLDLAAEQEAIHLYTAHADATDDTLAQKVLRSVADEEIQHAGEFKALIERLNPPERDLMRKGRDEVEELARELAEIMEA
jgi:rubrerythrin